MALWVRPYGAMGQVVWVRPYRSGTMGQAVWVRPYGAVGQALLRCGSGPMALWVRRYGSGPMALWVRRSVWGADHLRDAAVGEDVAGVDEAVEHLSRLLDQVALVRVVLQLLV